MHYTLLVGSHRPNAQSLKVAKWLEHHLQERGNTTDVVHLGEKNYPLWSEDYWDSNSELATAMGKELEVCTKADGLIVVAPEWGGMVPAALKNFLLYLNSKHVGHKPTLLVSVSAGRGGSYPIAELRMSGYKNTKLLYLPGHLIVQHVESVMNEVDPDTGEKADVYIKQRALYALDVLELYTNALKPIRNDERLWNEAYKNGM